MPEHLRALLVILLLAIPTFWVLRTPACAVAMSNEAFRRRRNAWLVVTLAAFLSHNFWVFVVIAAAVAYQAQKRDENPVALYLFLLFAIPAIGSEITGLGVIKHFFSLNWLRLLALAILLPVWLRLRRMPDTATFGSLYADRFLLGYIAVALLLQLTVDTFTNTLRFTFYAFIDVFLPYYVASRALRTLAATREAMMAFVVAALLMVPTAAFEHERLWMLYGGLNAALGVASSEVGSYLMRGEALRAMASVLHPIVLGYVMAVALGLYLSQRTSVPSMLARWAGLAALLVGLIAPVSRGPWLGAAVIVLVFVVSGARGWATLMKLGLAGAMILSLLAMTPLWEKLIRFLPFVGDVETENIDYRQRLLEIAIQLILDNPWFGAYDYMYSPAVQELKQGQGIIDIVNSYLGIALSNGLVGLSAFILFFVFALRGVVSGMARIGDKEGELHRLGQGLLACILGILLMIFTVSSVSVIPTVYYVIGGVCVAYARIVASEVKLAADDRIAPVQARAMAAGSLATGTGNSS